MSARYPSLDQYTAQTPPAYNPGYVSPPPPASEPAPYVPPSYEYPSHSEYSTPIMSEQIKSAPPAPQEGLFQDMGFLQDAVYTQVSSKIFDNGRKYVDKNFGRFLTMLPLKYYFNVNNKYVFSKLGLLLFPFAHKNWARMSKAHNDLDIHVPPREDINAPDLYIPLMSFVTYILLVGFVHGTNLKFTPDVLGVVASTGVLVIGLEILLIKFGLYLVNARTIPFLDLLSYCGYLFVGLIVDILLGLLTPGGSINFIAPIYPCICMAFFMLRTLSPIVAVPDMSGTRTRPYSLFIIALLQLVIMYILGVRS